MSLQTHVNRTIPMGIEGDFASTNPFSTLSGPVDGGVIAAYPQGVTAGRFAWIDEVSGTVSSSQPAPQDGKTIPSPDGFVGRAGNIGLLSGGVAGSLQIAPGLGVCLYASGDFWLRLAQSSVPAVRGGVVYALTATGEAVADGLSGTLGKATAPQGSVATRFYFASSAQPGEMVRIASFGG